MRIGHNYHHASGVCEFGIWAPEVDKLSICFTDTNRIIAMDKGDRGYWKKKIEGVTEGEHYKYLIEETDGSDSKQIPDPVSFFRPKGVHGPCAIVDHQNFGWSDQSFSPIPLKDMIIYELHIGTFSEVGTFDGVIDKLDYLKEIGINTIQLMPVNQFPGERNWGYDGVYNFAVQNSYGGPSGLKELVNQAHRKGMAVLLDVVYNHLGPEGNYLDEFGPYFNQNYRTFWGPALNFDAAYSDEVRYYYIQNALYWMEHFHIDGLRLDAIHAIRDQSAKHILREMKEEVEKLEQKLSKKFLLVAESDLNDAIVLNDREKGGYALDGQWSDDFHHVIHTLLTGENHSYYMDYGQFSKLKRAMEDGFVYSWDYSPFRKKTFGSSLGDIERNRLITFIQNHDQVGNRMHGERLNHLVDPPKLKVAIGLLFTSLCTPLIFMGEEYASDSPFLYFVHHSNPELIEAVRRGRMEEFKGLINEGAPDPQNIDTFKRSKLNWDLLDEDKHRKFLEYYKILIKIRKTKTALIERSRENFSSWELEEKKVFIYKIRASSDDSDLLMIANFSENRYDHIDISDVIDHPYNKILDSATPPFDMEGESEIAYTKINPESSFCLGPSNFIIYEKEQLPKK